jgi:hypothetical protein
VFELAMKDIPAEIAKNRLRRGTEKKSFFAFSAV